MTIDMTPITASDVVTWLSTHPEFFHEYAEVLAEIKVPHPHAEHAVPLIERQLLLLRDKNRQLASHMRTLLRHGEKNDVIIDRTHHLAVDLMRAATPDAVLKTTYSHLRLEFNVPCAEIRLTHSAVENYPEIYLASVPELARMGDKPYCGSYASDAILKWFPEAHRLRSFARVALRTGRGQTFGMLALASDEASRFTSDMDTDLLANIAELIAAALERAFKIEN